jgi:hypothetical protein
LIQSFPPSQSGAVGSLLARLRAPNGAEMLRTVLFWVEEALVRLADEIGSESLKIYRDAARECLNVLARNPGLSDESHTNVGVFPSDPVYKIIAQPSASDRWEKRSLRNALLCLLLQESPSDDDITKLTKAIKLPPVISQIPVPPDSPVAQLTLIKTYLQILARADRDAAETASLLHHIHQALLVSAPKPEEFCLSAEQLALVKTSAEIGEPAGRKETSSDLLNKLTISLVVRAGASIRHVHKPLVQQIPDLDEVARFLSDARRRNPDLGDWLAINTVLSTFSNSLLAGPKSPRFQISEEYGSAALVVSAPALGKKGVTTGAGDYWETICPELILPIPTSILKQAMHLRGLPEYAFERKKKQLNDFIGSWANDHGPRMKLGALHRVLPAALGGGKSFDATLLHLLGLSDISRRDAGIHYFSPEIPEVLRRYQGAVTTLLGSVGLSEWLEDGWTEIPAQAGCFGASARPSREAITRLVKFLRDAAQLPRGKPTPENRVRTFNAGAAYQTVLYLAATGARPTGDVFPTAPQWDRESAESLLSEKDSLLYRSTRKLPVEERMVDGIAKLADRQHAIELVFGKRFDPQLLVFLIDSQGLPLPPTIANMKAHIPGFADHWPWPNDILRHHFRSRLWELDCDAIVLEHAMGHLGKSQTPDTPLSMRPISETVCPAVPYITRLLDEIGF